ncbi:hypothetical protein DFH28DRAFT_895093 [Melampsora americana]|nr:hypothetical protein DFH28DRAFT_895093 [Melampsora americana]
MNQSTSTSTSKPTLESRAQFVPNSSTTSETFLSEFWSHITNYAKSYQSDFKDSQIPLARIKKLMKTDPEINMIATEVVVMMDKACEIFVNEITVRSYLVASASNRRTLNTDDIAIAISKSDMFDFLIDIVTPPEHPASDEPLDNSLTSPTSGSVPLPSKPSKKRPRARVLTSPIQSTSNLKKKTKRPLKLSRNLLPEEIAVPIPESERLAERHRLQAVPIPDSELIPPPWEMAVPISNNQHPSTLPDHSHQEDDQEDEKPNIRIDPLDASTTIHQADDDDDDVPEEITPRAPRTWEMAVPISASGDPNVPAVFRHPKGWELAVPISESEPAPPSRFPQSTNPIAIPTSHLHSPLPGPSTSTFELAVPIENSPSPTPPSSPSQRAHHQRMSSNSSTANKELLIDPALRDLRSSNRSTHTLPSHSHFSHAEFCSDRPPVVKQEEE